MTLGPSAPAPAGARPQLLVSATPDGTVGLYASGDGRAFTAIDAGPAAAGAGPATRVAVSCRGRGTASVDLVAWSRRPAAEPVPTTMPTTAIVWFRRDLRVHDHPALAEACREFDRVVPLFVLDDRLLRGRFRSLNRTAWMLGCLEALDGELRRPAGAWWSAAAPRAPRSAASPRDGAGAVEVSDDVTGFARARDDEVEAALARDDVELRRRPGLYIADLPEITTKQGRPYTVFTPFLRTWRAQERRPIERAPAAIELPRIAAGRLPSLKALGFGARPPQLEDSPAPGEAAAKRAAQGWLR